MKKSDLLDNDVVESVIRVYFPTMEKLKETLLPIQKENPSQLKLFRHSYTEDVVNIAKSVMFSIGAEGYKLIVEQEASDRADEDKDMHASTESFEEPLEPDSFLYPLIVAVSEASHKKSGDVQVVESKLCMHFPSMDNMAATESMIRQLAPKTELQTHLKCNKENIFDVADFMILSVKAQQAKETGKPLFKSKELAASGGSATSILSAVRDNYFPGKRDSKG